MLPRAWCLIFLQLCILLEGVETARNSTVFPPLYKAHSDKTPRFLRLAEVSGSVNQTQLLTISSVTADGRSGQGASAGEENGICAPGSPCINGACCSNSGWCGYGPDFCGEEVCISNCDAKAECGEYSDGGSVSCPLNVCCSEWGFCGSTEEFCGTGCQGGYGTCGEPQRPYCSGGSAEKRRIGYYESWATMKDCDALEPDDLVLAGLTHLNFAFAFFDPSTFEIAPMDGNSAKWYTKTTSLKSKKPGLQVWIAVGGWSFNDNTNIPNTRTAFSDMAASREARQAFIASLTSFMRTNSFDGADLDWEYPGAEDRGGIPADTANFVSLLKEMKTAFGKEFGLSITIPASYWYLRWFDVKGIEPYVDWMNMMTYDIHGVWDGTNKFSGPYVRPHTNLTDIEKGLDLLWRSNIAPNKLTLGLAYYGRSFTLKDPSCDTPGCLFRQGGNPGECSNTRGVLTNAEIHRIIEEHGLTPTFDADAAVNWIKWNNDQWVSYDDGLTIDLKRKFANRYCLGGTMIWALDQDDKQGTSASNNLGFNQANSRFSTGISLKQYMTSEKEADFYNQCYTSFCGTGCKSGFFTASLMNGQVGGVPFDTRCPTTTFGDTSYQYLCCPTSMYARCQWRGFHGEGMACKSGCPVNSHEMARNTNYKLISLDSSTIENTCNGGSMSYCCDFVGGMEPKTNPLAHISLLDSSWEPLSHKDLQKRDWLTSELIGTEIIALSGGKKLDPEKYGGMTLDELLGDDYSLLYPGVPGTGPVQGFNNKYNAVAAGGGGNNQLTSASPTSTTKGTAVTKTDQYGQRIHGSYTKITYGPGTATCAVTYTCRYGVGFDEVCDNQRSAITELRGGQTVYRRQAGGRMAPRSQTSWRQKRHSEYREWGRATGSYSGAPQTRGWCEAEEFPMAGLVEAQKPNVQAVRQVDGLQNGQQGRDYQDWLAASWSPCSALLKRPPPITWMFDMSAVPNNDARKTATSFLRKYGYDRQDPPDRCFARVTGGGQVVTISDHGFRVLAMDDIFYSPINWPLQDYSASPNQGGAALPTNVNSAGFLAKRDKKSMDMDIDPDVGYLDDEDWEKYALAYELGNAEDEEQCREILHAYEMWQRHKDTAPPPEPTSVWMDGSVHHSKGGPSTGTSVPAASPGSHICPSYPKPTA